MSIEPNDATNDQAGKVAQAGVPAPARRRGGVLPPRCRGGGYLLVGQTAAGRCPECGRPFDMSDPRSVQFGRRRERATGWVGRRVRGWMAVPVGWPTIVAGLLATAAVLSLTRWPASRAEFLLI